MGLGGWLGTTAGIAGTAADDGVPAAPTTVAPSVAPSVAAAAAAATAAAAAAARCVGQCGLCGAARLAAGMTRSRSASKQRALG